MGSRKGYQKKSMAATKSVDLNFVMECTNPLLSDVQITARNKAQDEYDQFMKKFNESLSKRKAEIVEKGNYITIYEMDCSPPFPTSIIQSDGSTSLLKTVPSSTILTSTQPNLITSNNVLLSNGNVTKSVSQVFNAQQAYQFVMAPRMGLIVTPSTPGTVNSSPVLTNVISTTTVTTTTTSTTSNRPTTGRVQVRPGLTPINNVSPQSPKRFASPTGSTGPPAKVAPTVSSNRQTARLTPPLTTTVSTRSKGKTVRSESNGTEVPPAKSGPVPNATAVVDLTDDDCGHGGQPASNSKDVSGSNRYPSRLYPSLVVVARPNTKVKEMTNSMITAERSHLDTKVKGILTNSPTKFTEWLIQQGLVRSEQYCTNHVNETDLSSRKLKLGMYSDTTKFPHTGGYVWISECCPHKFISVFCNSIFELAPHPPSVLLKLMYHWACQTNVHNIISWVKVDHLYIKNFFTNLRAVCTAAVCEKFGKMGGSGKKIEVGVISLGTTTNNGSVRQVKVEVLGIMDPVTKYVRLRAVEPILNADKNHKLRFSKILESLKTWVHSNTTIVTDFTVDKSALIELGFNTIIQSSLTGQSKDNNQAIMDYLKRVVPRMFQNTLSLLSRSIIQQFLDELVWRERWGATSSRSFDNLITHLAEMTKLDTGDTLMNRLRNITSNSFRDWSYKNWKTNCALIAAQAKKLNAAESNGSAIGKPATSKAKAITSSTTASKTNVEDDASVISLSLDESSNDAGAPLPLSFAASDLTDDDSASVSSNSGRRSKIRAPNSDDTKSVSYTLPVMKALETYYYGSLPPDGIVLSKLRTVDLNMKCFVCGLTYNNNIQFMKHLAGHAQNEGAFTTEHQCRYCFKNFTTDLDLEDHKGMAHFPNKYNLMCLICTDRFRSRKDLVNHMQSTHVELELPYQCNICKFRCSEHSKVIDHFYEVHNNSEKVLCPFCLKNVTFESASGNKIGQNVNFFYNHLQRHQRKHIRKCSRCVLTFVNKAMLKDHQSKYHTSCVNVTGVLRYPFLDMSTTFMPVPPASSQMTRKSKLNLNIPNTSTIDIYSSLYYPDTPAETCLECKTDVVAYQHFTSYIACMKCTFASCCKETMNKHIEKFHEQKGKRKISYKKRMPLTKPLHCVCGFSSSCGNEMASHLVNCKRRVAYSTSEQAAQHAVQMQSASFPPFVNLDDMEPDSNDASDKWMRAFVKSCSATDSEETKKRRVIKEKSPPRMLRELGLVRKESSSSDAVDITEKSNSSSSKEISFQLKSENENDTQHDIELLLSDEEGAAKATSHTVAEVVEGNNQSVDKLPCTSNKEQVDDAPTIIEPSEDQSSENTDNKEKALETTANNLSCSLEKETAADNNVSKEVRKAIGDNSETNTKNQKSRSAGPAEDEKDTAEKSSILETQASSPVSEKDNNAGNEAEPMECEDVTENDKLIGASKNEVARVAD